MKNIIALYNFVFVRKELKDIYPHATWTKQAKYHARNGFRYILILLTFFSVGYTSARIYNYLNPIVRAQTVTIEVPKKESLSDYPMLEKICNAEVTGNANKKSHQFNTDGSVVRGRIDKSDIGYCQINERYNNDLARKLGYDIYSEDGNQQFAIYLFKNRGTEPWNASKDMWLNK